MGSPRLNATAAVVLMVAGIVGGGGTVAWVFAGKDQAEQERAGAQGQAKDFAQELAELCRRDPAAARRNGVSCTEASSVATKPVELITGPGGTSGTSGTSGTEGPSGRPGGPGRSGRPGGPGSAGSPGASGLPGGDGTSGTSGTSGTEGPPGANGSPGADSTVPGPSGPSGPQGPGVITGNCVGPYPATFWFGYSDGTTASVTCSPPPPTLTPGNPTN